MSNEIKDLAEHSKAVFEFVEGMSNSEGADASVTTPAEPEYSEQGYVAVLDDNVDDTEDIQARTPMEIYEDSIGEYNLTLDDAARIVDALVHKSVYTEEIPVTRKLTIKLRTRTPSQVARMYRILNDNPPEIAGMAVSTVAKYNVAFSLVSFGAHQFDPDVPGGLKRSMDFIDRLPGPLYNVLISKLSSFDDKLQAVMQEEAIVNF